MTPSAVGIAAVPKTNAGILGDELDSRSPDPVSVIEEGVFRDRARELIIDSVTAAAVQAKAAYISNN